MKLNRRVRTYTKQHKRLGKWHYAVMVLTAVIVFCTVYALILPAITMERESFCGFAEHTHSELCYDEEGTLICALEEHTHTEECFSTEESPASTEPMETFEEVLTEEDLSVEAQERSKEAPVSLLREEQELSPSGADGVTELDQTKTYLFASQSSGYSLVYSGGWKIQNSGGSFLTVSGAGQTGTVTWTSGGTALTPTASGGKFTFKTSGYNIIFSGGSFEASMRNGATEVTLYDSSPSGGDSSGSGSGSGGTQTDKIKYSKKIQKTGGEDDYSYKLHLQIDGSQLSPGKTVHTGSNNNQKFAFVIDVTQTMTATDGAFGGTNKFAAVERILNGSGSDEGLIKEFLKGEGNEISLILVAGVSGGGSSYRDLYTVIKGKNTNSAIITEYSDVPNSWNATHHSTGLSYTTGLLAVQDLYPGEDVNIVFITGNEPLTYVRTSDGQNEFGTQDSNAQQKNSTDSIAWLNAHRNYSLYGVGINDEGKDYLNNGSSTTHTMKDIAEATGGRYYEADNYDDLKKQFEEILITINGDKTTGLHLTDKLSGNVSFPSGEANASGTITIGENDPVALSETQLTVDYSTGEVTIDYPDEIEGPFVIDISFDIETKDGVYYDPDEGYPDEGQENTDFDAPISAGKEGYFSNDASSSVEYSINGSDPPYSHLLPMPVVQAPEKEVELTRTVNVTKHWADSLTPEEVIMTVYTKSGNTYTQLGTISLADVQDATGSYTYTFESLEKEKTIYLVETTDVGTLPLFSGETVTITLDSGDVTAGKITLTPGEEDIEITVTNWPKTQMPSTGGMGTAPFIIIGSALALFAGFMLIYRKKRGT